MRNTHQAAEDQQRPSENHIEVVGLGTVEEQGPLPGESGLRRSTRHYLTQPEIPSDAVLSFGMFATTNPLSKQASATRQVFTNPGEEVNTATSLGWDFLELRTLLAGSPENVIEKIQELQEVCGLNHITTTTWGTSQEDFP